MGLATGLRGNDKLEIIRLHRLLEFNEVWDKYLQGRVSAELVKIRARKMVRIGLPENLRVGIKNKRR